MSALRARIESKIIVSENGCWIWQGWKSRGYGRIDIGGRKKRAHRVAYEEWVGPIPPGLQIDHLCRTRACCNPQHLEPVTFAENMRRAVEAKTQCPHGHAYTPENTRVRIRTRRNQNGRMYTYTDRECRTCRARGRGRRPQGF